MVCPHLCWFCSCDARCKHRQQLHTFGDHMVSLDVTLGTCGLHAGKLADNRDHKENVATIRCDLTATGIAVLKIEVDMLEQS